MGTGFRPTYVIAWAQTELDGLGRAAFDHIAIGSCWRWTGTALRIDVPLGPLVLAEDGAAHARKNAAADVCRLVGLAMQDGPANAGMRPSVLPDFTEGFVVTDGLRSYELTLIDEPQTGARLIMAEGEMPPEGQDLWVIRVGLSAPKPLVQRKQAQVGVICFCPGTRLATPDGARPIEALRPGDLIATKDNGAQPIQWIGHRRLSGARLHAMPQLRPICLRSGALGEGQPDGDLFVSPQHRMLVKSPMARDLFASDEVLVTAEHLLNGHSIARVQGLREVTYVHVMLERHNVIWANGLETESFHPDHMDLTLLAEDQSAALTALVPGLGGDRPAYGVDVRRRLDAGEAGLLRQVSAA